MATSTYNRSMNGDTDNHAILLTGTNATANTSHAWAGKVWQSGGEPFATYRSRFKDIVLPANKIIQSASIRLWVGLTRTNGVNSCSARINAEDYKGTNMFFSYRKTTPTGTKTLPLPLRAVTGEVVIPIAGSPTISPYTSAGVYGGYLYSAGTKYNSKFTSGKFTQQDFDVTTTVTALYEKYGPYSGGDDMAFYTTSNSAYFGSTSLWIRNYAGGVTPLLTITYSDPPQLVSKTIYRFV